jgi:glucose/arabinose dehydrogenase
VLRKLAIASAVLIAVVLAAMGALWLALRASPHEVLNAVVPRLSALGADYVDAAPIEAPFYDYVSQDGVRVRANVLASLRMPWGLAFLPDGRLLVTEKIGALAIFDPASGSVSEVSGVPEDVFFTGQGGLMDVALAPDFERTGFVFLSYTVRTEDGGYSVRVVRMRLDGAELLDPFEVLLAQPSSEHALNFGTRLEFDAEGWLYVTVSDHKRRDLAQDPASHLGKTLRYASDGSIPAPENRARFADASALPELWTIGHRNPQGLFAHPETGEIWMTEHGEQGGDEINILRGGANYGWPEVSHSEEYGGGPVGEGQERADVEAPLLTFTPTIAPTQLLFYEGAEFPEWNGQLLVATLGRGLIRLGVDAHLGHNARRQVRHEDRTLLLEPFLRIRDIAVDGEGRIYAATERGWLLCLESLP